MPTDAFTKLRRTFAMFGLGQKTGVDLPGEVSGIQGRSYNSAGQLLTGSVLDLSYGNYDAYTPIQLVQYISTIDRKSTRLNSSHVSISYAVFCLKKKKCITMMI